MTFRSNLQKSLAALSFFAIAAAVLAAGSAAAAKALRRNPRPKRRAMPRVLVTISKETTYITEPLRVDGYPDYIAALNRRTGEGVTPDNNAAVPFWRAVGPGGVPKDRREKYFRMLDILPLARQGRLLRRHLAVPQRARLRRRIRPRDANGSPLPAEVWKKHVPATIRPWSTAEFPLLAQWVAGQREAAGPCGRGLQAAAVLRSAGGRGEQSGGADRVSPLQRPRRPRPVSVRGSQHRVAKALVARAMLRLQEGKRGKAWEDLMACHRLARLAGQGPTGFAALVAWAIDQRRRRRTGCCWSTPGRPGPDRQDAAAAGRSAAAAQSGRSGRTRGTG